MNVSDASHAGWHDFARKHGMSLAVLLEVMGRHLDEVIDAKAFKPVEDEGRDLAHQRRRAGGPKPKD